MINTESTYIKWNLLGGGSGNPSQFCYMQGSMYKIHFVTKSQAAKWPMDCPIVFQFFLKFLTYAEYMRNICVPCLCIKECYMMNQQMHTYKCVQSHYYYYYYYYYYYSPTCFSHSCDHHQGVM
jgi:hypothetical protein